VDSSYILSTINPVVGLLFASTFFLIWRQQPHRIHILNWSMAFAIGSMGFAFEFLNHFNSDFKLINGINIFVPVCVMLIARGLCLRYTGQAPTRLLLAVLVLSDMAAIWINFVHHNALGRGLAISIGIGLMLGVAVRAIVKARLRDRIDVGITVAISLAATLVVTRPVVSFFIEGAPKIGAIDTNSFWTVSLKVAGLYSLLVLSILFMLRIAADLFAELNQQSLTDSLSRLLNRRGFFAAAETAALAATPALPVSVLLIDIDHFKKVNDSYGHQTGDRVIKAVAAMMQSFTPESGIVGRLGGEEFAIVLPNTSRLAASAFAEALRTSVHCQRHAEIPATHPVTVSIGLAEGTGESLERLLHLADLGLYRAKNGGRDQVQMGTDDPSREERRRRPDTPLRSVR